VPEKFEFLKQENQYKLNALTAFLFEKYGFEVLYKDRLPLEVDPCSVLQAEVQNKSSLFRSRVYVTLENCREQVVFTTKTGNSREKDFEKSYHEALREAFTSLEELQAMPEVVIDPVPGKKIIAQDQHAGEVVIDPVPEAKDLQKTTGEDSEVIIDPVITPAEIEDVERKKSRESEDLLKFMNGPFVYLLKPTSGGYELFREGEEQKFGTLLKSGGGENYLYSSKKISGNAFFDTQGNLIIEYLDPSTQQMITVKYQLQSQ
jgi:hypothetical protein